MKRLTIVITLFIASLILIPPALANTNIQTVQQEILHNAKGLNPQALKLAMNGFEWAKKHRKITNPNVLTIIDFSKPSYEKRLWVIDLKTNKVLMNIHTTHGKKSGLVTATKFSNKRNSDKTSLGLYKTLNSYTGQHGTSLLLEGLEPGLNDNARRRTVVIHPAWYVTPGFINKYHRAGRSLGCFAINPAISKQFVNTIKDGSLIFAYSKAEEHDPIVAGAQQKNMKA